MPPGPFAARVNLSWYLVDTRTAAHLAHVKPATVRTWHRRGYLRRYGNTHRALYDIREILARTTALDNPQTDTHPDLESGGL
jgi:hypothetical protein